MTAQQLKKLRTNLKGIKGGYAKKIHELSAQKYSAPEIYNALHGRVMNEGIISIATDIAFIHQKEKKNIAKKIKSL